MRTNTKTRLGLIAAGTGVAALAVTGLALPANAEDTSVDQAWTTDTTHSMTEFTSSIDGFKTWVSDTLDANAANGDVTLVEGPLVGGDVLSGPIGSGNQAPIGSGNDTPIGSGNDVSAPVGSGNDTNVEAPVDAPVGSGNDVSAPIEAPVDAPVGSGNSSSTDTGVSVGDIGADVDNLVNDVTGDLGLGDILG